jgi:class 3 adenylate cyclase
MIGIGIHTVEVVARNICTAIRQQKSIAGTLSSGCKE